MTLAYATGSHQLDLRAARQSQIGTVRINVSRLIRVVQMFVAAILILGILREIVIASIGTETVLKDLRHFALDAERSLPSWYESISMFACALMLAIIAALSSSLDRVNTRQWIVLAAIFLLMSIDSSVSFHEVTVAPLRNAFHLTGALYFSWVVLATPVVMAVGLYFLPFLMRLPAGTAIRFMIAGSIFVGGALGTEFLCGYVATEIGMDAPVYKIVAAGEEILESIGLTLFLSALLQHAANLVPVLRFDLRATAP